MQIESEIVTKINFALPYTCIKKNMFTAYECHTSTSKSSEFSDSVDAESNLILSKS